MDSTKLAFSASKGAFAIEKLGFDNYRDWAYEMEHFLRKENCWKVFQPELAALDQKASYSYDTKTEEAAERAYAYICMAIEKAQRVYVRGTSTPGQAWRALERVYRNKGNDDPEVLKMRFLNLQLAEGGSIKRHLGDLMDLRNNLDATPYAVGDGDFLLRLFNSLPKSYDSFILAMKCIPERKTVLTPEFVMSMLVDEADRRERRDKIQAGLAASTSGQGIKQPRSPVAFQTSTSSEDHLQDRGGAPAIETTHQPGRKKWEFKGRCFECKQIGHRAKDCPAPKNADPQANAAVTMDSEELAFTAQLPQSASEAQDAAAWIVDSGASSHMTFDRTSFTTFREVHHKVKVADAREVAALGVGTVNLELTGNNKSKGQPMQLRKVLYVPELNKNLFSVSAAAASSGMRFEFSSTHFTASKEAEGMGAKKIVLGERRGNLYYLRQCKKPLTPRGSGPAAMRVQKIEEALQIARESGSADLTRWHGRLGHLCLRYLKQLPRMVDGIRFTGNLKHMFCDGCALAKSHRQPFPSTHTKCDEILGVVHADLVGPFETLSVNGERYCAIYSDEASAVTGVGFLKYKDEALQDFKSFKTRIELQTGKKIKVLRTDGGGEFTSNEFQAYLTKHGINHQVTAPYTPQQNGLAERKNKVIVETARAMLLEAGLPRTLWTEAVRTAVYLRNRSPTSVLKFKQTPMEAMTGQRPDLSHLRIFGCEAFVHIPAEKRKGKLSPRSVPMVLVGYDLASKAYRLADPASGYRRIVLSRDVVFNEDSFPGLSNSRVRFDLVEDSQQLLNGSQQEEAGEEEQPQLGSAEPVGDMESDEEDTFEDAAVDAVTPDSEPDLRRSSRFSHQPVRDFMVTHFANSAVDSPVDSEEPLSYKEAISCSAADTWKEAMEEEMKSLQDNETWELAELPKGRKAISCKWLFKVKRDKDGHINRHKARLVARGFTQVEGIDYQETFSPVVKFSTIRMVLSLAAQRGLRLTQMDFKTAFLNGVLDEELYMKQPAGYVQPGQEHFVCRLRKSIYGLKQASRSWNQVLNRYLVEEGYTRSEADLCLYIKRGQGNKVTYILCYVDDLLIATDDSEEETRLKRKLQRSFKMTDLGDLSYFLGLEVKQEGGRVTVSQRGYVESILKRFGMQDCKPAHTPLCLSGLENLFMTSPITEEGLREKYMAALGSVMYAMLGTRPDIAYAVGLLGRFASKPTMAHWTAMKRLLQYLKASADYSLTYTGGLSSERFFSADLVGFTDADWAGDKWDRKSTSGYVFFHGGAAVTWKSKKQATVALSSTEAEYIALSEAAKEAVWLRQLLRDLGAGDSAATVLYEDNMGSIFLSSHPVGHQRTKHIEVRCHFVRHKIEEGELKVTHLGTEAMIADVLTKALPRDKHMRFAQALFGDFASYSGAT